MYCHYLYSNVANSGLRFLYLVLLRLIFCCHHHHQQSSANSSTVQQQQLWRATLENDCLNNSTTTTTTKLPYRLLEKTETNEKKKWQGGSRLLCTHKHKHTHTLEKRLCSGAIEKTAAAATHSNTWALYSVHTHTKYCLFDSVWQIITAAATANKQRREEQENNEAALGAKVTTAADVATSACCQWFVDIVLGDIIIIISSLQVFEKIWPVFIKKGTFETSKTS